MRDILAAACLMIAGCAGSTVTSAPARPGTAAASPTPIGTNVPPPTEPQAGKETPVASSVAPDECNVLVSHSGSSNSACPDRSGALAALDLALAEVDATLRDLALARLDNCAEVQAGLTLALRAEFAPVACGDVLVADYAVKNSAKLLPALRDALLGLKLAAQLTRLVRAPPQVEPPFTKARIGEFTRGVMSNWATLQANAISDLALQGSRLSGYGKGIVAVEAGMADMRFVEVFRKVPLPTEYAGDAELTDVYYSALDQGLEPRKTRGRDAALVGLRVLAEIGVLHDPRVQRARSLLSELYNGRRINALDGLLLTSLPEPVLTNERLRLAAKLPTFYAPYVLGVVDPSETGLLRALLERGLPVSMRDKLDRSVLTPEIRTLYARGLFELGRTYWRASELGLARSMAFTREPIAPANKLVAALSSSLEKGPKDAAAMMLSGPVVAELGNTVELEALGNTRDGVAAMAIYDAAFIRELAASTNSNSQYFQDLASRYARAARMLTDPGQKKVASDRAKADAEIAKKLH